MNEIVQAKYQARAVIIKAMSHPSRLLIIDVLAKGKKSVGELTEMISADTSTVSKHLSVLKNAGLVKDEKQGLQVFYTLRIPCISDFFRCVDSILQANADTQVNIARCCL